jgi:hypothetical protein
MATTVPYIPDIAVFLRNAIAGASDGMRLRTLEGFVVAITAPSAKKPPLRYDPLVDALAGYPPRLKTVPPSLSRTRRSDSERMACRGVQGFRAPTDRYAIHIDISCRKLSVTLPTPASYGGNAVAFTYAKRPDDV